MDLEAAYDRYGPAVYRHALALTRSRADADDAVQTVFLKLAARMSSTRLRGEAAIVDLEAYLHVAVRREALRNVTRRKPVAEDSALELVIAKNGLPPGETMRVNQALAGLPAEQSEVVMLHVYEEMSFRRIGELLGIPPDTAASRYRYAREKLKEALGGDR